MGIFSIILTALAIGIVAAFVLGRFAFRVGVVFLLLGVGPMAALLVYETCFYKTGDTSAYGMLSTIAFILFVPFGLILIAIGALRGG